MYFLSLEKGHKECTIVHLEMVIMLLAIRLFCNLWSGRKVLVRCDNNSVVSVLRTGWSRDPFLSACTRNIWYCSTKHDIDVEYVHIRGYYNKVADLLSRWSVAGTTMVIYSTIFRIRAGYKQMSKCWHFILTFNLPDIPLLCSKVYYVQL